MAPSNQNAKDPVAPLDKSPYGKEPEPGKAPEAIARTVATMPPEQMFKLMVSPWSSNNVLCLFLQQEIKQTVTSIQRKREIFSWRIRSSHMHCFKSVFY